MAPRKKTETYVSHATPKEITATSRCAVKIGDNFYTIETSEKKEISNPDGVDMDKEWNMLFDEVNSITDNQVTDIINMFKDRKRG